MRGEIVETDVMLCAAHRIRERPAARHDDRLTGDCVERPQPFGQHGRTGQAAADLDDEGPLARYGALAHQPPDLTPERSEWPGNI